MEKIKTAVIGVGYLGKFHAEKYATSPQANLIAVCDIHRLNCEKIADQYGVPAIFDYHELIGKVDAVSIAVPTFFHYAVAKTFLENGVHVLLEKPITNTVAEAEELITIAKQKNVILQIGHLERFNRAMHAVKPILNSPNFIESYRLSPFQKRGTDVNVVLDLMIHDIDIIQHMVDANIRKISATGATVISDHTDVAHARIEFDNGCIANVAASRVSAKIQRKLRIFQPGTYIALDLHNKKINVHHKKADIFREEQSFESSDALRDEINAFLDAIIHGKPPIVSGEEGKKALATAIEISRLLAEQNIYNSPYQHSLQSDATK